MPIWDIISTALNNIPGSSDWWSNIDSSSYTSTIGDQTSFVLGGTQAYNAIGSSINLTADWEESLSYLGSGKNPSLLGGSMLGLVARGLVFGIGGNADLVVGNDSSFNYCGESFSVNRNRHEFTCTVPPDSHAPMPTAVKCTLGLGIFGLLASSITARILYNLNGVDNSTVDSNNLLMELIPELESTWLEALKLVEFVLSLKTSYLNNKTTAESILATAETSLAATEAANIVSARNGLQQTATFLANSLDIAQNNVQNYTFLAGNVIEAELGTLSAITSKLKGNPAATLTTQTSADLYNLSANSCMLTTMEGPIILQSNDYNAPANNNYGSIALNASQIGFTAQGSASITMNRQDFNTNLPPNISLMTMGNTSSAISLIAQQKTAGSSMASITAGTNGITLFFGSNVPANSFMTQMTSTGVTIKQNPENGPQIQLGANSIKLSVGNSSLTINNDGITINATKVEVISGDSKLSVANAGISTTFGDTVSNTLNAQGHKFKAAESAVVVEAQAISLTAANLSGNLEAGDSIKATIQNMVTEAINSNKAGVNQNNPQ